MSAPNGVLGSAPVAAAPAGVTGPMPRDALAIQQLLASMGLQPGQYQPRVIAQLMEIQTRYTREILEDAQEYCQHRERSGNKCYIEPSDIDLAVESRLSESLTSPPSKELLFGLAATRNLVPLPLVPTKEGVHLPSERYCLMQPNYRVKTTPPTGGAGRRDDRSHS